MSDSFLHIAPAGQQRMLPEEVRAQLHAIYAQVPGVSCQNCDRPGQCCELTEDEWHADFATMYPLYPVEYLNIVDHVRTHFDPEQQQAFLSTVDERPMRCPFLTSTGGCSIHSVRPLTCRTYGVLNHKKQVSAVAKVSEGQIPSPWLKVFLSTESHTVCQHTELREEEKLGAHMHAMISFEYERQMVEMSNGVALPDAERQEIFELASGQDRPVRWTWGGFNALMQTPLSWLKTHFKQVWTTSFLAE